MTVDAETRLSEEELYRLGTRDAVTGLPNRLFFIDLLKIELEQGRRSKSAGTFVMILLGGEWLARRGEEHDRVADAVGRVLRRVIRTTDIVGRLASDRFGVYLPFTDVAGTQLFADRMKRSLASASKALGAAGPIHAY